MTKLKYNKTTQDSTPSHLKKHTYKRATRKQVKLMKELGIDFHPDISSYSASCLISAKLGKKNS